MMGCRFFGFCSRLHVLRLCGTCGLFLAAFFASAHFATVDAQSVGPRVLPAGKLPDDARLGALKTLNGYFPFTPPKSREEWEERAEQVRRQMQVATGLWPMPEKTPLNAVVYGKVDRDGYTVEKVYFESYPGHFVTGSLYRPKDREGKLPAVLCPHGHFPGGRFNETTADRMKDLISSGAEKFEVGGRYPVQAYPVQLARMGCIAFQYDMVGYADSVQIPNEIAHSYAQKRPQMDTRHDWGFYSTQADLRLQSIMGLQTYNSIRAIDFLLGLPDVDAQRIGVTGASSGGTQTLMLCGIDSRPAVAVPAVMVSTAMQGGCTCENCQLLRIDTGNVEFAALLAPKPLEAISADDWTHELTTKGGPELQQLYTLLGAKDNVSITSFLQFKHNFNYVSRAAMYPWMNEHLKLGLKEPIVEEDFVPLKPEEATVWDEKHPKPAGGEDYERKLLKTMTDDADRQLANLVPRDEKSLVEFRRVVGGAWETIIGRGVSKPSYVEFQQVGETARHDKYLEKTGLLRFKPAHEELPIVILQPLGETRRTAIWIDPAGKAALYNADGSVRAALQRLLEGGVQIVGLDLLDQGEFLANGKPLTETGVVKEPKNAVNSAAYTFGYNRPLFAERVHDILTAASYFRGDDKPWGVVDLVGLNGAGHWVAAAKAMAGDAVDRVVVDTGGFRFVDVPAANHPDFLPGAAKYFDLPGLLALCAPGEIWLSDVSAEDSPTVALAAYTSAGAAKKIEWPEGGGSTPEDAAVTWLLRK
jgi:hypothetical protein